ncbi:MAG: hypothetical protein E6Q98_26885 [Rhodospirillaceae bacterium]|nr:MAG: hypothetical protein E6Q98_26885 [Rhodospirillaceae bacterium]
MTIALIRARKGLPVFCAVMMFTAFYLLLSSTRGDDGAMDDLVGATSVVAALAVFARLAMGVPNRQAQRLWHLILVLLGIVCAAQFLERYADQMLDALGCDDAGDLILMVASPATLWLLARFDPIPRLARSVLWLGVVVQLTSMSFDLLDHILVTRLRIDSDALEMLIDFSQFLALQVYFIGVALFLLALHVERLNRSRNQRAVGDLARFLFIYRGLYDKLRYPNIWDIRLPLVKPVLALVHLYLWLPKLAPLVRAKFGKPIAVQLREIAALGFNHGLDAQTYYMFELYRPAQRQAAAGYLARFETKNGLFKAINELFPPHRDNRRSKLGDKLMFARLCAEHDLACVPLLLTVENGAPALGEGGLAALRRDLFVKPRKSKGARGAGLYRYRGDDVYVDKAGDILTLASLIDRIAAQSRDQALMVQPRLINHPDLADLADQSLLAVRVITCLDELGRPRVTHAMLRILCMLEPAWPTEVELAAEIDLATGSLGQMTADKKEMACSWFDRHPITGIAVSGRTVPQWNEIKDLALRAHVAACSDRFIVGWDIASTPDGPVILEGNSYPDVEFLQRVHRRPIGQSPMSGALFHYLMRVEKERMEGA